MATPAPTEPAPSLTADEQHLLDGILRDAIDCRPIRDELPEAALAGIECDSSDVAVARMGFFLFADDDTMLAAYTARMDAEGVELDSDGTDDEEGESAYVPGPDGEILYDRHGRFVNAEGFANYRATISAEDIDTGAVPVVDATHDLHFLLADLSNGSGAANADRQGPEFICIICLTRRTYLRQVSMEPA